MQGMNSNSLAASLVDGYGRLASVEMLDALGLDRDDEFEAPPTPARPAFNAGAKLCRTIGRPANCNLRVAV